MRGGNVAGVTFHTDKGGEYTGGVFTRACDALAATQPMGRIGSALDNAAAESFNSTLEHELLSRRRFTTRDQGRREVAAYIDAYNSRRRHSSAGMLPPVVYESVLAQRATGPPMVDYRIRTIVVWSCLPNCVGVDLRLGSRQAECDGDRDPRRCS